MTDAPPLLNELDDHVVTIVLQCLDAKDRRAAACTCKRWRLIIRGLQTVLVLEQVAAQECNSSAFLLTALSLRPHVSCLRCLPSVPADLEWLAFVCGALASRLLRLHLCWAPTLPTLSLQWLRCLAQLQDLVLVRSVASVPPAVASLHHLTRLVVVCRELDADAPTRMEQSSWAAMHMLRTLWLEEAVVVDGTGAALAGLQALESLTLRSCMLPHDLLPSLGRLQGLLDLNLSGSVLVGEEGEEEGEGSGGWEGLPAAELSSLCRLALNCCGLRQLPPPVVQHCSLLRVLSFMGNGLDPDMPLPGGPYLASLEALALDPAQWLPETEGAQGLPSSSLREPLQSQATKLRLILHPFELGSYDLLLVSSFKPAPLVLDAAKVIMPSAEGHEWVPPNLGAAGTAAHDLFHALWLMQLPFQGLPDSVRYARAD